MFADKNRKEWEEAAAAVQDAWMKGLEEDLSGAETEAELPAGMKERLAQVYRDAQMEQAGKAKPEKKRPPRRPAFRWAAVGFAALVIVIGSWLAFDKTARAEAADWMKGVLGIESSAQEAYDRLLRFLGGTPDQRDQYRDPKGEAWRPYFGGAWLNGEKELIVAVTDDSPEVTKVFQEAMRFDRAQFRKVKYSYDELYAVYKSMIDKAGQDPFPGLAASSLDIMHNQIEISFAEDSTDIQYRFLTWLEADVREIDMFRFESEPVWIIRDQEDEDLKLANDLVTEGLLENSRLTELGDVEAARMPAQELPPEMMQDIEEYMQYKAETEFTVTKLDKQVVEEGDLVKISYRPYTDSLFLETQSIELPCKCGGETAPGLEAIQSSVTPGRRVGESYTIDYADAPYAADEPVYCDITILYIYRAEAHELDDAFVQEFTEYSSVEEWRAALVREKMNLMSLPDAWDQVLKKLLAECTFEMDEETIRNESGSTAEKNKMRAAIHEYLLVQAIADHYGITVTDADVQAYVSEHQISLYSLPGTAYTACEWRALREKVMEKMTEPQQ
nr:hypothetical protein [Lachnospiraceae bacterium]